MCEAVSRISHVLEAATLCDQAVTVQVAIPPLTLNLYHLPFARYPLPLVFTRYPLPFALYPFPFTLMLGRAAAAHANLLDAYWELQHQRPQLQREPRRPDPNPDPSPSPNPTATPNPTPTPTPNPNPDPN